MAARKKQANIEYQLFIAPHVDELRQTRTTIFRLQTVRRFASFRYDVSIKEEVTVDTIRLKILGLKAPQLSLPASGHAGFIREFDDLLGEYDVIIESLDGKASTFRVYVSPDSVRLIASPKATFVELIIGNSLITKQ